MEVQLGQFGATFLPWKRGDGRVFSFFAYDTETTQIDEEHPNLTPAVVIATACDGHKGVFVTRDALKAFFLAHKEVPFICHNAAFDLRVTEPMLGQELDIYAAVDKKQVWDTLVLHRLHSLATAGHTARGNSGLAECVREHLGLGLPKEIADRRGKKIRTNFGQFLGQSPGRIPAEYLAYAARDTLATWHLFHQLQRRINQVLAGAAAVWGSLDAGWLHNAVVRFGPLTHHVQLRASILMDVLNANGIGIDAGRAREKATKLQKIVVDSKERLRKRGYLPGEKGSDKALQSIIRDVLRAKPGLELRKTPSGKWGTAEEDLAVLAAEDSFFKELTLYRTAQKLMSTYVGKLAKSRLHAKFGYLLETGRTSCGGGFNLQNLPREKEECDPAATVRGCFVPAEGHVFVDADYKQIELVVFAYALDHQFGYGTSLTRIINDELKDVHKIIAGAVLGKDPSTVTDDERNSAKPVSFGRPGGMGAARLQDIAKSSYGIELSHDEVASRIQAYHDLCPELSRFLEDELNTGLVVASAIDLTPAGFSASLGHRFGAGNADVTPQGWLGGMLLKVLRDETPVTGRGRQYSDAELDYFWDRAQLLTNELDPKLRNDLQQRRPGLRLWKAVRHWAGRRPVFTLTGRLRAGATFCSSRNCIFQGAAADGAILGLWRVWRAGFRIVNFVHDQIVVEALEDDRIPEVVANIESLMRAGMREIVPGMRVGIDTLVTRSLSKLDKVPRRSADAIAKSVYPPPAA
jgi:hypothetical protein